MSPQLAYSNLKEMANPTHFGQLFKNRKQENKWTKKVVNKVYFNKALQRTTERQVGQAVRNKCMGRGPSKWHRLKTH